MLACHRCNIFEFFFGTLGRELFNENAENVIVLDDTTNDQLPPVEDMDCQTKISPVISHVVICGY